MIRIFDLDYRRCSFYFLLFLALFEWCGWYFGHELAPMQLPDFMSINELIEAGFNINTAYRPTLTLEEFKSVAKKELQKTEPYYNRNYNVTQHALKLSTKPRQNIFLVGHAPTLDACAHQLVGNKAKNLESFNETMRVERRTYCEVSQIQEYGNGKWQVCQTPFPPLNHRSTTCGYHQGLPVAPWKGKAK